MVNMYVCNLISDNFSYKEQTSYRILRRENSSGTTILHV